MPEFLRCRHCGKILCASDTPLLMTSVDAARIFHKRHKNIMRDIKKMGQLNFEPSSYKNSQGRKMPCFKVNWDGLRLLSRRYILQKLSSPKEYGARLVRIPGNMKKRIGECSLRIGQKTGLKPFQVLLALWQSSGRDNQRSLPHDRA